MLERLRLWPPDYTKHFVSRQKRVVRLEKNPKLLPALETYYASHPKAFIQDWGVTVDQRNVGTDRPTHMPLILFERQDELVDCLERCRLDREDVLIEKSRDMGATWVCCNYSTWLWRFHPGSSVGWGSRVSALVDTRGVIDSLFEKMRTCINWWPKILWPIGFAPDEHMLHMRIINPDNNATIVGEGGENIGRGGRTTIYFKDEAAWYEHPEAIEAALTNNTNCQVDISSVHGLGNVFHRKREAGVEWDPDAALPKKRTRIFIMDWRDHPDKTQEWYDQMRQQRIDQGMLHLWAQEVDRNYSASIVGTVIPYEWVKAAEDAHLKLNFEDDGGWGGGLDVADGGGDTNALALRKGIVLKSLEEWGERDTGVTARRAITGCKNLNSEIDLQYDCMGVGAGIKAEYNRLLLDDRVLSRKIRFVAWAAGAEVLYPDKHVIPGDRTSPLNKDFYENLKAQAWWQLRLRFERTFRAVNEPDYNWDASDLISIDTSAIPVGLLRKLEKELSQVTSKPSSRLKLMINKAPEGTKSPNLADAVVEAYWPVPYSGPMRITQEMLNNA